MVSLPWAARIACPYCYHRVDGSKLWFQCAGRPAVGYGACAPARDEVRERETGYTETARPSFPPPAGLRLSVARRATCPDCGGVTGIRVCSCCHTPVPSGFGEAKSPLIAMVGAKHTGKTVYLGTLARELRHGLRRRFEASVSLVAKPQGFDATAIEAGKLYEQTAATPNGRSEPIVFEWRQERRIGGFVPRLQTTYLSFYDTAGEDLTELGKVQDLAYLGAADALILLLDPFMIPQARSLVKIPDTAVRSDELTVDVVRRVTETLRVNHGVGPRRKINIPVAVAFAKIDAFFRILGADHPLLRAPGESGPYDETAGRATHEFVKALLYDWEADDIDRELEFNYSNFRYFAISALGAEPDYEAPSSVRAIRDSGVQPFRVGEPLTWLLSEFGVVARTDQQ